MQKRNTKPKRGRPGGDTDWSEVSAGIGLSVLFHGLVFGALIASIVFAPVEESEDPEEIEFQDVDLLALGEEPEPDNLPRLTGDEGAPPETGEPVLEPEVEPEPQPEPEPEPEEPEPDTEELERQRQQREEARRQQEQQRQEEERRRRMDEAMGRFEQDGRGDEAPEGSPDGVAAGTATEGTADMRQTYQAKVLREIERHWEVPAFISESELQDLAGQVRVEVRLSDSGHIDHYEFREQSNHDHFDDYVERALRAFQADEGGHTLPLPADDQLQQVVLERGLVLSNWERLDRQ